MRKRPEVFVASRWLFVVLALSLLLLPACGAEKQPVSVEIRDLRVLNQDPTVYAGQVQDAAARIEPEVQYALNRYYDEQFFSPWDKEASELKTTDAFWGIDSYSKKTGYGQDGKPYPASWFTRFVNQCDAGNYPSLALKGIIVRNSNLRVMPTREPFYYDPAKPGEGYPFDYFQNSAIWAGTPVFISHVSLDGKWLLAEAGYAWGWVPVEDIAVVDDAFVSQYRNGQYAALLKDNTAITDAQGAPLLTVHIGSLFPLDLSGIPAPAGKAAILAATRDPGGRAVLATGYVDSGSVALKPTQYSPMAMARVCREIAGQRYTWGGLEQKRDCSAMTRDIFAPFGVWLPRNSTQQGKQGLVIGLEGMSSQDKQRAILEMGVPFRTLIWLKGHIMLYIGEQDGRPLVFHQIWGVRTLLPDGSQGRNVIGKAVVTSLEPGIELDNVAPEAVLIERVLSMSILGSSL